MNYLDIKKDLEGFYIELGHEELIKGILAFELGEKNGKILEELYDYYMNYDGLSLVNELIIEKYNELKGGE